jgi:hypothetical protein
MKVRGQRAARSKASEQVRLLNFRDHLLCRYRVKMLAVLPAGPKQDFIRAAERAGITAEFIATFFGGGR